MDQMAKKRIKKISKEAVDRIDNAAQKVQQDILDIIIQTKDYEEMELKAAEHRLLEAIKKELISQRDQELYQDE